jgi:hypothetical protein
MGSQPKYSLAEIERRWLVDLGKVEQIGALGFYDIEDLYIANTALRLRKMKTQSGHVSYKLCKKYERTSPCSQPITNIYLTATEYDLLCKMQGDRVCKRRYSVAEGSVDVYPTGLAIFEIEFESEDLAQAYSPPGFAIEDITDNVSYSGAGIAKTREQVYGNRGGADCSGVAACGEAGLKNHKVFLVP